MTPRAIEDHIKRVLFVRIPSLRDRLKYKTAYGKAPGADLRVEMKDGGGATHYLLVEVEQYASGKGLENKVKQWASRHFASPNTTTLVVSLLTVALSNLLSGKFERNPDIKRMVQSTSFRVFPGVGDGSLADDLAELHRHLGRAASLKLADGDVARSKRLTAAANIATAWRGVRVAEGAALEML